MCCGDQLNPPRKADVRQIADVSCVPKLKPGAAWAPRRDIHREPFRSQAARKWLFVFNSNFLRTKEDHRSASSSRQSFDRPPTPSAKGETRGRTTGGRRPNKSERHAWRSESRICKPRKKAPSSALSNEGTGNNRSRIDPSRCRSSSSFGNLRKLCRSCVTDTWGARFVLR
jgi:hypothetical protein